MKARGLLVVLVVLLVTTAIANAATPPPRYPWDSRIARATRFAANRDGKVGFAVIDGYGVVRGGRNIHQTIRSASVVKAVMLVCYLDHRTVRNRALSKFDRNLLNPMIRQSADALANWIYTNMGPTCLRKVVRAAKMEEFNTESVWGKTQITPLVPSCFR